MRQHTNELADALQGSFSREVTVNVFHGTERVALGLRFATQVAGQLLSIPLRASHGAQTVREGCCHRFARRSK